MRMHIIALIAAILIAPVSANAGADLPEGYQSWEETLHLACGELSVVQHATLSPEGRDAVMTFKYDDDVVSYIVESKSTFHTIGLHDGDWQTVTNDVDAGKQLLEAAVFGRGGSEALTSLDRCRKRIVEEIVKRFDESTD